MGLKIFKPVHWLYNLIHYKKLLHNRNAYLKYGVKKPLIGSISSADFPDRESKAWLDTGDSKALAPQHPQFHSFSAEVQSQLQAWSENGFLVLPDFFSDAVCNQVNKEIDELVQNKKLRFKYARKLMFANKKSKTVRDLSEDRRLLNILSFILGKELVPFQTINFLQGSEQRAHSDSIHMTTYPLGYLIAAWVALEDVHADNGPLFYYPGSHKLPFLLNSDYNEGSTLLKLGKHDYNKYEDVIEEVLQEKIFERKEFFASKGDVFIWHANLAHGGSPIINNQLSRKSMVIHYYAKDVIKYHEITERPSLMNS